MGIMGISFCCFRDFLNLSKVEQLEVIENTKNSSELVEFLKNAVKDTEQHGTLEASLAVSNRLKQIQIDSHDTELSIHKINKLVKVLKGILNVEGLKTIEDNIKNFVKNNIDLHKAIECGALDLIKVLCQNGVDVDLPDQFERTPLHKAACTGNYDLVELLLKHHANVNLASDINGVTPLYLAVQNKHKEIVELLLKNGANPNQKPTNGLSPLYLALEMCSKEIVEHLLSHGASVDETDEYGNTFLLQAIENKDKEISELLLEHSANVHQPRLDGETPLNAAAASGDFDIVELLLQYQFYGVENGCSPFMSSSELGQMGAEKHLI
jgi:ankyrin repeat protein